MRPTMVQLRRLVMGPIHALRSSGRTTKSAARRSVQLVGLLPGELGGVTLFATGIRVSSKASEAAKSLIQFLTGPAAAPVFKSKGLQPG